MSYFVKRTAFLILLASLLLGCNQPSSPVFKEEIGGLKLVRLITGEDAVLAINNLHGKEIDIIKGMIACYQGEKEKATIWLSESASENDAIQQTAGMVRKMRDSKKTPFSNYEEIDRGRMKIYSFMGMGQQHYIVRVQKSIYWISANPGTIDKVWEGMVK
jgi:hypothetical protein